MGKDISPKKIAKIEALRDQGLTYREISGVLQISKSSVSSLLQRVNETGRYTRSSRAGKNRKTSDREDRVIQSISVKDPKKLPRQIGAEIADQHGIRVSYRTVKRRLTEKGLNGYVARKKTRDQR